MAVLSVLERHSLVSNAFLTFVYLNPGSPSPLPPGAQRVLRMVQRAPTCQPDTALYTALITACCRADRLDLAFKVGEERASMRETVERMRGDGMRVGGRERWNFNKRDSRTCRSASATHSKARVARHAYAMGLELACCLKGLTLLSFGCSPVLPRLTFFYSRACFYPIVLLRHGDSRSAS